MTKGSDPYFSKTIEKGLIILNLFDRDHTSRRLSEIAKLTGINKTSVFRFVNTLVKLGYLRKSTHNNLLRLGPRAFVLGQNFFHGFDILQSVKPIIDKTFLEHGISIDSAILHENSLISLYRREVPNIIFLRLPLVMDDLYARAMGKAVLAHLETEDLRGFLDQIEFRQLTPNTVVDREALMAELAQAKEQGYTLNDEEYVKGLTCIGAPVFNYNTHQVAGAVSLDFPSADYSVDQILSTYAGILTKLASEMSEIFTLGDL
ncbi:MAG: IclR family transcriptional regulator [Desulfosarcinaceae bacterium]|nr:IclR family transcriptional regulator [Desulfosarcinaceae bacterium]